MITGSPGVVGSSGTGGGAASTAGQTLSGAASAQSDPAVAYNPQNAEGLGLTPGQKALTGQGAQFVYVAATVANVITDNLSATQINLLANFLSVVTTCVYAILTVENPTDIIEA